MNDVTGDGHQTIKGRDQRRGQLQPTSKASLEDAVQRTPGVPPVCAAPPALRTRPRIEQGGARPCAPATCAGSAPRGQGTVPTAVRRAPRPPHRAAQGAGPTRPTSESPGGVNGAPLPAPPRDPVTGPRATLGSSHSSRHRA